MSYYVTSQVGHVTLLCVLSHSGFIGNGKANDLAKVDARKQFIGPEPLIVVFDKSLALEFKQWHNFMKHPFNAETFIFQMESLKLKLDNIFTLSFVPYHQTYLAALSRIWVTLDIQ